MYVPSCNKYIGSRELYWSIIVNIFDVNISAYLYNLPVNELTGVILGRRPDLDISNDQWQALVATCAKWWQILYEPMINFYYFLCSIFINSWILKLMLCR